MMSSEAITKSVVGANLGGREKEKKSRGQRGNGEGRDEGGSEEVGCLQGGGKLTKSIDPQHPQYSSS